MTQSMGGGKGYLSNPPRSRENGMDMRCKTDEYNDVTNDVTDVTVNEYDDEYNDVTNNVTDVSNDGNDTDVTDVTDDADGTDVTDATDNIYVSKSDIYMNGNIPIPMKVYNNHINRIEEDRNYDKNNLIQLVDFTITGSIAILMEPLVQPTSNSLTDQGTSDIWSHEINHLAGNYTKVVRNDVINDKSKAILKFTKILKDNGTIRLICSTSTKKLNELGIDANPKYNNYGAFLNMKHWLFGMYAAISEIKDDSVGLINLDLTNAYSRIKMLHSNIYLRTKDNCYYRLEQPVQGLSVSGTVAPHVLYRWYRALMYELRNTFNYKHIYLSTYSDNGVVIAPKRLIKDIYTYITNKYMGLINLDQSRIIDDKPIRVLGFKVKVESDYVEIKIPNNISKSKSYYINLLGRKPKVRIYTGEPLVIHTDSLGNVEGAINSWVLYQDIWTVKPYTLAGDTIIRTSMDQSLGEAYALKLGSDNGVRIESLLNTSPIPVFTDSKLCIDIIRKKRPRCTPESMLLETIRPNIVNKVESKDNVADAYTREDIHVYCKRKHPKLDKIINVEDHLNRKYINVSSEDDDVIIEEDWKDPIKEPIPKDYTFFKSKFKTEVFNNIRILDMDNLSNESVDEEIT